MESKPKFQQRHYETFAMMMQEFAYEADQASIELDKAFVRWARVRDEMASIFSTDNPRFDRERFIKACELGSNVHSKGGKS